MGAQKTFGANVSLALCVLVYAVTTFFVARRRVYVGAAQRATVAALSSDPAAFVAYTLGMTDRTYAYGLPYVITDDDAAAKELYKDWETAMQGAAPTDDDASTDFVELFMLAFGSWLDPDDENSAGVARLLSRHCGSKEFMNIVSKHDDALCTVPEPGCIAGFFVAEDETVKVCPEGAFCPSGQTCFVLCAKGAFCKASEMRALPDGVLNCVYPSRAAQDEHFERGIDACPGAKHETLCPAGFYCATPVEIASCPRGHYCPLGTDKPLRCPWFARCTDERRERPEYKKSFSSMALFFLVSLFGSYWLLASLRRKRLAKLDTLWSLSQKISTDDVVNEEPLPTAYPRIEVGLEDLTLSVPLGGRRLVLDGVSAALKSGRFTAIVGPSGSGKTSLLDVVVQRRPPPGARLEGRVTLNGFDRCSVHPALFACVPQDDSGLIPWLSVRETLCFYAATRERRERCTNDRGRRDLQVAKLLVELGLHGERDSLVGVSGDSRHRGLSGGQRKRVSVGVELVGDPSVLLLDEPTSGLDAATSRAVVAALVRAARRGLTVAAVLHQPSARMWRAFDDVIVLAPQGRLAYYGPQDEALGHFQTLYSKKRQADDSIPDFVLECVSSSQHYSSSTRRVTCSEKDDIRKISATVWTPSAWEQLGYFVQRAALEQARHPGTFAYEMLLQISAGLILGALYPHFDFGDAQQVAFILQLSLGLTTALSAARTFGFDRAAAWREISTAGGMGLHAPSLFGAKCLVELPRLALLTLAFLSAWYPTATPRGGFAAYFGLCFGAALAASGAAHVFAVAQDAKEAQLSTVFFLVASSMFSGVSPRLHDLKRLGIGARIVVWSSYARWLVEACFVLEASSLSNAWRMPPAFYKHPMQESAFQGLMIHDYVARAAVLNTAILVLIGVGLRLVALLALVSTNRDRMGLRSPGHVLAQTRDKIVATLSRGFRKRRNSQTLAAASRRNSRLLVKKTSSLADESTLLNPTCCFPDSSL